MKVHLMHPGRDFVADAAPPPNAEFLVEDLQLETLLRAMDGGERLLYDVSRAALLQSLTDPDEIVYRQEVLRDCLHNAAVVEELYALSVDALDGTRRVWRGTLVGSILSGSVEILQDLLPRLRRLRQIALDHAAEFSSIGFRQLFETLLAELNDPYFAEVEGHLNALRFRTGVLLSARLGPGNKALGYVLRRPLRRKGRRSWPFGEPSRRRYAFEIHPRDEAGGQAIQEIRVSGIAAVANAAAQSADHVRSFFTVLRRELAFYRACTNLHTRLVEKGEPVCFPEVLDTSTVDASASGLYDPCLSLSGSARVVGNDLRGDGRRLVVITGANQGGKSTFLRSVGLAQLMMQAGMFVAALAFQAVPRPGIFTHFKREEDPSMTSGKLEEELGRMAAIAELVQPSSLVLCNESFASTNEREGSEIARHVVHAFVESGIKVFFVTHLYDLAHSLFEKGTETTLFLRAERGPGGERTFRLIEREPLPTSFGSDVYAQVFDGLVDSRSHGS
jgi:hypothetical protein